MNTLARTARPASRSPTEGLPFPFLTTCWRIGLSGCWLRVPRSDTLATRTARPAPLAPVVSAGPAPIWQCLVRSRLTERLRAIASGAGEAATEATLSLLIRPPRVPGGTAGTLPLLWRPLGATVIRPGGRVYVPVPRPRWDPLTWILLDRLLEHWETEGVNFVNAQRRQLYLRMGTRRMARTYRVPRRRALACGRAAYRIWRYWYETTETAREARVRQLPLPAALGRTFEDPARLYRAVRRARRMGQPVPYAALMPAPLSRVLVDEVETSIRSFPRQPVTPTWPLDPVPPLARALEASPLAEAARQAGVPERERRALVRGLARDLVRALGAPWSWTHDSRPADRCAG